MKSIQFAILPGRIGLRILDEFTHQREGEAVPGDELGFEHVVIIGCLPVGGACQTMLAVSFGEPADARAINGDDVILIEQAIAFEYFLRIRISTRRVTHSCACCGLSFEKV